MSREHQARLRGLTSDKRERVEERACIMHDGCSGLTWEQADELAWLDEVGGQRKLGGVR